MAGLNFQTQTIINSNLDPDSGKGVVLFESKKEKVDGVEKDVLKIKRDFLFVKDNVDCIRRRKGYAAELCEATIDFTKLTSVEPTDHEVNYCSLVPTDHAVNYCRLDIYIGIEGAEPYIYSTPWYHKGKPFWVEFIVKKGDKAKDIADRLEKTIKSNHMFQVDKDLIKVANDGAGKITLTGATEYQRFRKITLNIFEANADYANLVTELNPNKVVESDAIALVTKGKNAFGTYSQIVKDLRLPTAANYQWLATRKVEIPIVGAVYNQYIIEYHAPANSHPLSVVGGRLNSYTTHVFWVKNDADLVSAWETALKKVGTIVDSDTGVAVEAAVEGHTESKLTKGVNTAKK